MISQIKIIANIVTLCFLKFLNILGSIVDYNDDLLIAFLYQNLTAMVDYLYLSRMLIKTVIFLDIPRELLTFELPELQVE